MSNKKVVYVVYYSMYGHVSTLAKQVMVGLEKSGGILIAFINVCNFPYKIKI